MNVNLLIIGVLLLILGYIIGVKERIEFLTFTRNRYIKDKKKVINIMGTTHILSGAYLITFGLVGFENDPLIIIPVIMIILIISIYVIRKYIV